MASTYTDIGTELMTTGENAGNWGTKTNTNLKIIEEAVRGYVAISANSDQTLSLTDGTIGDSIRNAVIAFTGTLSANRTITVPSAEKWWIMDNQTAGAYTLTVKVSGQTGITWGASDKGTKILYSNGTDIVDTNIGGGVGGHDLNGEELILDADADTSITSDTDDQIDIKIAGADDFQFTANTFTAQAGSTIAAQALTATTVTASGIVKTDDTTEATSTTDGSLQTDGGLSVAKDAVFGDDVKLLSDSAVLSFGADSDTTLTHTDGTGLTLNSTNKFLFRDTGLYINSSTDGQLDIVADTEIQIAATTIDINGAVALNGAITGATNITLSGELDAATLDISGNADIDGTTNLDSVDIDGAVQIDGATTVGVDGTGLDVKFFGDTAGSFLLWDQSADALLLTDSTPIQIGDAQDLTLYHDGTNSYITNAVGALKVATETSGIAVTIGHSTSEVTVADNLTVTGTLTLGSGAELTETELEFLDGITAGTAAASKAMVLDASADITGGRNLTISGELDAATGDFSGDVDVDGTLEADAITIGSTAIGSIYGVIAGSSSIVTTGALDSGSITSGFGAIDNGTSNIRSATITAETAFVPDASGGADLGTTALEFNDLFLNDSGSIQFGDDQDTTLVHTDGTGLTLNSTNKFCFRDTALFINSSTDGQLDIDADTEVEITATTVDVNGNLDVSGTIVGASTLSATTGTFSGVLKTDDATEATSTTDGSLQTDGGLSVVKDVILGDDLTLISDAAVLKFGANAEVTLTHVHNDGLLLNTDMQLQFRDSAINIRSDADGDLDINADDELELNSTLIDVNGNLDVSGTLTQAGVATFSLAANVAQVAITSSSNAIAWDASAAANAYHITTENTTFSAPSNAVEGAFICVEINYNGSHTIAFNTVFEFAASTAPTTTDTDGKTDILVFRYSGAVWQEVGRTLNLSES